ncbi:MAG: methylmalonyl Co-A mutase-associated GTPase MeaB [Bacteroidota bacterium]|jgi:LAO/AO transport system kinase
MLIPELPKIKDGDELHIARALSWVENQHPKALDLLKLMNGVTPVIGITGPPGAGKSTLVNSLVNYWAEQNLKIAILAVDPSSAFNFGSLLGDRLRMQSLFLNPNVYIRSVSSRGSLGGLSASIIEMVEVLKFAPFDRIIIETVGVGQSEVEIAGLADTTIVVSVPESGDEIQTLKSGIMEIADVFVVNKSDRDGAAAFASYLMKLAHVRATESWECPVILTQAMQNEGIPALAESISKHQVVNQHNSRKKHLFAEKAYKIIQRNRMKDVSIQTLQSEIETELKKGDFNLFQYLESRTA